MNSTLSELKSGTFTMSEGRIRTRSLEVHIVDHCNLRCAECCSLSPFLPKWCIDPSDLERDLRLARRALAPTWFKLVGGEPLLHPAIDECLAIARRSGLAEIVSVTTNGHLLPRTSPRFWTLTQALTISLYPAPALSAETVAWIERQAAQHDVRLNWKRQDRFVQMNRALPRDDAERTGEIYADCWLRRRCNLVSAGRFYTCTRPPHFETLLQESFQDDGITLHEGNTLAEELLAYLRREQPLAACARCEGGHAAEVPHRQMDLPELHAEREKWIAR
jgi:GTP 3',8-cyclase